MEHELITLKDGSRATVFFVRGEYSEQVPKAIVTQMQQLFNDVIEEGKTYPNVETLDYNGFKTYWMKYFCAIMVDGEHNELSDTQRLLGTYYVKPNYVGRCSKVSNAGFLVTPSSRGRGVGKALGKTYVNWGGKLGYKYSVFNLVFETNVASVKIWQSLGFDVIGRIPDCATLEGYDEPVSALIFGKAFPKTLN